MRGFFLLNNLLIAKYRYLTMKIKYPSLSCPSYHGVFFFFLSMKIQIGEIYWILFAQFTSK